MNDTKGRRESLERPVTTASKRLQMFGGDVGLFHEDGAPATTTPTRHKANGQRLDFLSIYNGGLFVDDRHALQSFSFFFSFLYYYYFSFAQHTHTQEASARERLDAIIIKSARDAPSR